MSLTRKISLIFSSLRAQLIIGITGLLGLLLFTLFTSNYFILKQTFLKHLDMELREEIAEFSHQAGIVRGDINWSEFLASFSSGHFLYFEDLNSYSPVLAFQAKNGDLYVTPGMSNLKLHLSEQISLFNPPSNPLYFSITLDGKPYRAVITKMLATNDSNLHQGSLIVAFPTEAMNEVLFRTKLRLGLLALATLIIGSLIIWFFTTNLLYPLHRLTETTAKLRPDNLNLNIPIAGTDEVQKLGLTLQLLLEGLTKSYAEQRCFWAEVSHELQTPIVLVKEQLKTLSSDNSLASSEAHKVLERALRELSRVKRLANELVTFVNAVRPDFLSTQTFSMNDFLEDIFQSISSLAERNFRLLIKVKGDFRGDKDRLTQVLLNLINNAVEQTSREDTITLGLEMKDNMWVISVEDTGPGLSPEEIPYIFERFYRGQAQIKDKEKFGLGLSIAMTIVKAHGGIIQVESEVGQGSKFKVILPEKIKPQSS